MKKIILVGILAGLVCVTSSGCCSYMSYKSSERELIGRKIQASGDAGAIKAYNLGQDAVGIGVNVLAIESITEHPIRQILAAVADAGLLYAVGYGISELNTSSGDDDADLPENATDSNIIQVNNSDSGQVTITINPVVTTTEE